MSLDQEALDRLDRLQAVLAGHRDLPPDLRRWLLDGLREYRGTGDLTAALGLRLPQGSGFNASSLIVRAALETALLRVADHVGPRDRTTAGLISLALKGDARAIPSKALDFLYRARRVYGDSLPTSRGAIADILRGETQVGKWGLAGKNFYLDR